MADETTEKAEEVRKGKAVPKQVDEILADADEKAEAGKKPAAKKPATKKSTVPQVGADPVEEEAASTEAVEEEVVSDPLPNMPRLDANGQLFDAYLVKRLLVADTSPADGVEVVHEAYISAYLSEVIMPHYDLFATGIAQSGQNGNDILWQFVLPAEGQKPKYKEVKHFFRSVGTPGAGAVTGFQANETIGAYLKNGWELFHWETFGADQFGSFVMWVLVR